MSGRGTRNGEGSRIQSINPSDVDHVTRRFLQLYYDLREQTFTTTEWLGERVMKAPTDLIVLQEIVAETRPDLVIEAGVLTGGSTLFYASVLDLLGGDGRVIGVDVDLSRVPVRVRRHPRVELIEGSSADPQVVEQLRAASMGNRVMVDLDSAHDEGHVRAELDCLASLVTPGCYLVVEDTVGGGRPILPEEGAGPGHALDAWLAEGQPFGVDRWRERLLLTTNHRGYLRRLGDGDTGAWVDDTPPCAVPSWTSVETTHEVRFEAGRTSPGMPLRRERPTARPASTTSTLFIGRSMSCRRPNGAAARIASDSFRHAAQLGVLQDRLQSQRAALAKGHARPEVRQRHPPPNAPGAARPGSAQAPR